MVFDIKLKSVILTNEEKDRIAGIYSKLELDDDGKIHKDE